MFKNQRSSKTYQWKNPDITVVGKCIVQGPLGENIVTGRKLVVSNNCPEQGLRRTNS
jgi:hypothetical protein